MNQAPRRAVIVPARLRAGGRPGVDRDGVMVRYLGDDVIEVKGIGTFQGGTEALVPRELAFQLLESDDWAAVGKVQPAIEVVLNIGQWD